MKRAADMSDVETTSKKSSAELSDDVELSKEETSNPSDVYIKYLKNENGDEQHRDFLKHSGNLFSCGKCVEKERLCRNLYKIEYLEDLQTEIDEFRLAKLEFFRKNFKKEVLRPTLIVYNANVRTESETAEEKFSHLKFVVSVKETRRIRLNPHEMLDVPTGVLFLSNWLTSQLKIKVNLEFNLHDDTCEVVDYDYDLGSVKLKNLTDSVIEVNQCEDFFSFTVDYFLDREIDIEKIQWLMNKDFDSSCDSCPLMEELETNTEDNLFNLMKENVTDDDKEDNQSEVKSSEL